jgi:hypothetical protein
MLLACGCIHGLSFPFDLYTAVHTTAQCERRNSLTYRDKQVRPKWFSACHIEDDPAVGWDNQLIGEELK